MKRKIEKLKRIPRRIYEDIKIILLLKNWRSVLSAKLKRKRIDHIKFRNGIVVYCPAEIDLNFLLHEIWIDKVYNPSGYEVNPGDIVIDIGGNIGMFAIYAATRGKGIHVFSFEPFPSNLGYFSRNIQHGCLSTIKLEGKAVTGTSGSRFLNVSDVWSSHSLLGDGNNGRKIEVQGITLNQILEQTKKCDLLKIDCEGSEYEIFYSTTKENLNKIHRIVGEYHENSEGKGVELKKYLEDNDFRVDIFRKLEETAGIICATNLNLEKPK